MIRLMRLGSELAEAAREALAALLTESIRRERQRLPRVEVLIMINGTAAYLAGPCREEAWIDG